MSVISKKSRGQICRSGNGSASATNVVLVALLLLGVVVIRFSMYLGSVVYQLVIMKLFTHINETFYTYH